MAATPQGMKGTFGRVIQNCQKLNPVNTLKLLLMRMECVSKLTLISPEAANMVTTFLLILNLREPQLPSSMYFVTMRVSSEV